MTADGVDTFVEVGPGQGADRSSSSASPPRRRPSPLDDASPATASTCRSSSPTDPAPRTEPDLAARPQEPRSHRAQPRSHPPRRRHRPRRRQPRRQRPRHRLEQPHRGPLRPRRDHPLRRLAPTSTRPPARSTTSRPTAWMDFKAVRRSEREMHYGVAAAKQALADSGFEIDDANRTDVGVVFGSGAGGQQLMIDNFTTLAEKGPNRVQPTFIANALVDSTSGMIAIETGAIGHNMCDRHGLLDGHPQRRRGRRGHPPRRLHRGHHRLDRGAAARGGPRRLHEHARAWACRGRASRSRPSRARSTRRATASSSARARARCSSRTSSWRKERGAKIYAEVVGYGSAADGWDMIQPIEGGTGSARAMKMALERRGVPADEVDLINPHGTSTPVGDVREAEAIWAVFGDRAAARRQVARDLRHQVDDRPHDGRGRRVRGLRDGDGGRRADRARARSTTATRTPSATCGSSTRRSRCRSATRCPTTSASAATTAR